MSEIRTVTEKWDLTYRHSAGPIVSEFYRRVQEEGQIAGRRCPQCRRVLVPPRSFCDRCYCDTDEWVNVSDQGVVETFTVVYRKFNQLPDPPYAIAYVRLDGADTAILNYVRGLDLSDPEATARELKPGTRMRAVFAPPEQRRGSVIDFWWEHVRV